MEENNKIDDIFRSGLEDLKMTPSSESWNAISSKLQAKRNAKLRKKRGLWFSAAALFLITSYTALQIFGPSDKVTEKAQEKSPLKSETIANETSIQNKNTQPANTNTAVTVQPAQQKSIAGEDPALSTIINASQPAPEVQIAELPVQKQNGVQQNISSSQSASTGSALNSKSENTVTRETTVVSPSASNSSQADKTPSVDAAVAATTAIQEKSQTAVSPSASGQSVNKQEEKNSAATGLNTDKVSAPAAAAATIAVSKTAEPAPVSGSVSRSSAPSSAGENGISDVQNTTEKTPVRTEESASSSQSVEQSTAPTQPVVSENVVQPITETSPSLLKRILSNIALDIYYTPEYVQSTLKSNPDYAGPASKNLDDYKNEESQYSYSTGINLRYNIGSKWSIASGIQSSTYSKSAVYNTISVVADSVYQEVYVNRPWSNQSGGGGHHGGGGGGHHGGGGSHHGGGHGGGGHGHPNPNNPGNPNNNHHYIIHTPCGSIDLNNVPPRGDQSSSGDTLKVKTEVFETVSFINIPFLVRYSFGTKKLSYFIEGGGALNYVQTEKVKVVINDATTEDNSLDALSNMNYSILFGFGAQYNFYKGLSMFVKPSLRYSVTPINVDSPVESYPHYFGLSAGFSIHF